MEIDISDVVISLNGRDKGKYFIVIRKEDNYSFLADGKRRKLEKPKRKKDKHIKPHGVVNDRFAERLKSGEKITNKEVRKVLAEFKVMKGDVQ